MPFLTDVEGLLKQATEAGAVAFAQAIEAGLPTIMPAEYATDVQAVLTMIPASAIPTAISTIAALVNKAETHGATNGVQ